jgi:hypothetical protein
MNEELVWDGIGCTLIALGHRCMQQRYIACSYEENTSDVGAHRAKHGTGKGGKAKHILDLAGFVGWAHLINFGPG